MTVSRLYSIYKKHGITKQKLAITKLPDNRLPRKSCKNNSCESELIVDLLKEGRRIVFIDETLVNWRTRPTKKAFTPTREPIQIDNNKFSERNAIK